MTRASCTCLCVKADFVCDESLPVRKSFRATGGDLAPLLCGVVFIRKPAISFHERFKDIALGAMKLLHELIVSALGLRETRRRAVVITACDGILSTNNAFPSE